MSLSATKDTTNAHELDPSLRAGNIPTEATPEKLAFKMHIPAEAPSAVGDYVPVPYTDPPEVVDPQTAVRATREMISEADQAAYYSEIVSDGTLATLRRYILEEENNREA